MILGLFGLAGTTLPPRVGRPDVSNILVESSRHAEPGNIPACQAPLDSTVCRDVFSQLENPNYIPDQAGLTQTSGWVDAWILDTERQRAAAVVQGRC